MKSNKSLKKKLYRRAIKFLHATWPLDLANCFYEPNIAAQSEFKQAQLAIVNLITALEKDRT